MGRVYNGLYATTEKPLVLYAVDATRSPFLPAYVERILAIAYLSTGAHVDKGDLRVENRWDVYRVATEQSIWLRASVFNKGFKLGSVSFTINRHPYIEGQSTAGSEARWAGQIRLVKQIEEAVTTIGLGGFENAVECCRSDLRTPDCGLTTVRPGDVPVCAQCALAERDRQEAKERAEREAARLETAKRRAAERSKMTPALRMRILNRDGFQCRYCGKTREDNVELHIDHIVAIANDGRTVPENLQALCSKCNLKKRTKAHQPDHELVQPQERA